VRVRKVNGTGSSGEGRENICEKRLRIMVKKIGEDSMPNNNRSKDQQRASWFLPRSTARQRGAPPEEEPKPTLRT